MKRRLLRIEPSVATCCCRRLVECARSTPRLVQRCRVRLVCRLRAKPQKVIKAMANMSCSWRVTFVGRVSSGLRQNRLASAAGARLCRLCPKFQK